MKFKEMYYTYKALREHLEALKIEKDSLAQLGQDVANNLNTEVNEKLYQLGRIKVSLKSYNIDAILEKVESCMQDIGDFDR